jgi:hypothetical protein
MGWQAIQAVEAEYVVVSGPGAGVFVYAANTTPGPGNPPIAWLSQGSTDPFGNAVLPNIGTESGGLEVVLTNGAVQFWIGGVLVGTVNAVANGISINGTLISFSGKIQYNTDTNGNAAFQFFATTGTPTFIGNGIAALYANSDGTLSSATADGWQGTIPLVSQDTAQHTNANQTGPLQLSAIYTIPASDLNVGTHYIIEAPFNAMMESETLELGLSIDGATGFATNVTISGAIVGAGIGITGKIRAHLKCITIGSSGTIDAWMDGEVNQTSALVTFTNSGALAGNLSNGVSLNTQNSHTIRINSQWGGAAAAQTVSTYGSECYRIGT